MHAHLPGRHFARQANADQDWTPLSALDGNVVPLLATLSARPRRARRLALGAITLIGIAVWALLVAEQGAGAAVAPHLLRTSLVTVTEGQRAVATATNDGDACHRTKIALIDGDGRPLAVEDSIVCPGRYVTVTYAPQTTTKVRSIVAMELVPASIVNPCTLSLEVQDVDAGRTAIVVAKP